MEDEDIAIAPYRYVNDCVMVGESYLICSDGLSDALSDEQILRMIADYDPVKDNICQILLHQAEKEDAKDNMTAIRLYMMGDSE